MQRWVSLLHSLPTSGKAVELISDFLIRSGELAGGWPHACEFAKRALTWLLDNNYLKADRTPEGVFFKDTASHMTAEYRLIKEPNLNRHTLPDGLPGPVAEELRVMSNIKWTLNKSICQFALNLDSKDNAALQEIKKSGTFFKIADEAAALDAFYLPIFTDWVGRTYAEGALSYTGNKLVRSAVQIHDQLQYTPDRVLKICKSLGIKPEDVSQIRSKAVESIEGGGSLSNFTKLSLATWLDEASREGRSGLLCPTDFRTSGQMLVAIMILCKSLLHDTNLGDEDDQDLRVTISDRVLVPTALMPWADHCLRAARKPLLIQCLYGQSAESGAMTLFWDNPEIKDIMGWISPLGRVNPAICERYSRKWNSDFAHIISALGPVPAFASLHALSTEFNSNFWRAYPQVLIMRQKLEAAYKVSVERTGKPPVLVAPNGWTYTHQKWVIKPGGDPYRFRYTGPGSNGKALDISVMEMIDTASGFSLFVRLVHMMDAWLRHEINMRIIRYQQKKYGRYVGHGSIHDAFLVPFDMIPDMHGIVRAVLHEAVNTLPGWLNGFLIAHGQEPFLVDPRTVQGVHRAISRNRAFLQLGP